jgi:predicted N-acyltransferase
MDLRLLPGIAAIPAATWDALVPTGDPFVRHRFLSLMEGSGSATTRSGWQPLHAVLEEGGQALAACPLWAKSHSWGEYVFDHGWADALERAGGRYYPKLQVAVPFTPVPGPRLLAGGDPEPAATLAEVLAELPERLGLSSLHVTFCPEAEARLLEQAGFLLRQGVQYHWHNRGYRDFDDFLATLRSAKRKTMRKERQAVRAAGFAIEVLHGADLTPEILRGFYPFYLATVDKRWGTAYLTEAFFTRLASDLRQHVVYVVARKDGEIVGAALNLWSDDALYGRIWGALDDSPFLHFECCYYAAIEFAIRHGIARVEAGAQGRHKLLRGYEPVPTWSAHSIREPAFRNAVQRFLRSERRAMAAELESCRALLPYRREGEA